MYQPCSLLPVASRAEPSSAHTLEQKLRGSSSCRRMCEVRSDVMLQARMKETEKVMKQVDKEERRRSKQQAPSSSLFTKAAKGPLAATPPAMPRYQTLCLLMPCSIHESLLGKLLQKKWSIAQLLLMVAQQLYVVCKDCIAFRTSKSQMQLCCLTSSEICSSAQCI